ncbi:MAG: hypothetical protein ACKVOG_00370 [Rhodoglobus sp.]
MSFLGVVTVLGQLALAAMGGLIILASLVVIAGIAFPPLVAPLLP